MINSLIVQIRITMSKQPVLLLLVVCLQIGNLSAQESLGLKLGHYSGINGTLLNPAQAVNDPLKWDVNIVSAGAFVHNNLMFLSHTNLVEVLSNTENVTFSSKLYPDGSQPENAIPLDLFDNNKRGFFAANANIMGPSIQFKHKNHSFGLFTNVRGAFTTHRMPRLRYYDVLRTPFDEPIETTPYDASIMTWGEIGLNYGTVVYDNRRTMQVAVGATVKLLMGYDGFYAQEGGTQVLLDGNSASGLDIDIEAGYATGYRGVDEAWDAGYDLNRKGMGVSTDLGITWTRAYRGRYKWKMGVSLLDVGFIRFTTDARQFLLNTDTPTGSIIRDDLESVNNIEEVEEVIENQLGVGETQINDRFSIVTPTALSVQADYAIDNNLFVNAVWVQRVPLAAVNVERTNILAVTPRYEEKWWSVSVPVVLYDYAQLRYGLALRLGPLVIGSDNIRSIWTNNTHFTGSDAYVGLKINSSFFEKKYNLRNGTSPCYW